MVPNPADLGTIQIFVDGTLQLTVTTTVLGSGRVGYRTARVGAGTQQYDDAQVLPPAGDIPPGYLLEWGGSSGAITGDNVSGQTGTVNLRDSTGAIISSAAAPVAVQW